MPNGSCKLLYPGSGTATDLRRERFYSFAGKSDMDEQEVQELIEDATKGMDKNGVLVKAPRWGIGVHHAGVSIAYRRMVERMFRAKRMRVVFATGEHGSTFQASLHQRPAKPMTECKCSKTCCSKLVMFIHVGHWCG